MGPTLAGIRRGMDMTKNCTQPQPGPCAPDLGNAENDIGLAGRRGGGKTARAGCYPARPLNSGMHEGDAGMSELRGVGAEDAVIRSLLGAWIEAAQRYTRLFKGDDCCWWYNERTNVSVLAGAAWTLGWAALEECPTEKHPSKVTRTEAEAEPEDENLRHGRIDLYIATEEQGLTFEAKHAWQRLPGNSGVSSGRKAARIAALQIQSKITDRRYAATFIVPFFASNEDLGGQHLQNWIQSQVTALSDATESYGYYFPTLQPGQLVNCQDFTYPGVILVIEDVTDSPAAQTA